MTTEDYVMNHAVDQAQEILRLKDDKRRLREALQASPCGRLLLQCEHVSNADVDVNCLGCTCWRSALTKSGR